MDRRGRPRGLQISILLASLRQLLCIGICIDLSHLNKCVQSSVIMVSNPLRSQSLLTSEPPARPLSPPSAPWRPSALPLTPSWGLVASSKTCRQTVTRLRWTKQLRLESLMFTNWFLLTKCFISRSEMLPPTGWNLGELPSNLQ